MNYIYIYIYILKKFDLIYSIARKTLIVLLEKGECVLERDRDHITPSN